MELSVLVNSVAVVVFLILCSITVGASKEGDIVGELTYCGPNNKSTNEKRRDLVIVSTLDGRLSALNAANDGSLEWSVDTGPGPMLSSSIHRLELTNNGHWVRMIPSLTGGLYKFDGDNIEAIPISADSLLHASSFLFSDDLVISATMGSEQQFCLRWHNYQSSLLASLPQLLDGEDLTDVTLMAGGCNLKAHRVVLSACSQYFKELFKVLQPLQHPVIVLPSAKFTDLCALVTFMYSGEVNIYQEQLQGLLSMADALQIRGLAEVNTNSGNITSNDAAVSPKKDSGSVPIKRSRTATQTRSLPLPSHVPETLQDKSTSRHEESTKSQYNRNLKQTDNDNYSNMMRALVGPSSTGSVFQSDATLNSFNRKLNTSSDDFEPQTGQTKKPVCSETFKKTESSIFIDDRLYLSPTPPSKQDFEDNIFRPTKVKSEGDRNAGDMDSNITTELESVLRASKHTSLDDVEMVTASMYGIQGDQSPSSNDSTLDNANGASFNMDADFQRIQHLSQGQDLSKLSSPSTSSSHYTKLWSSSNAQSNKLSINSKLFATCFVCGKQLSNQYNLRVHMETHQNVNYACNVCNHVSRSRDALRKHVSYRHPGEAKEKGVGGGSSLEGQPGASNESVGRSKKSKIVANKDSNNNNNKRSHP